MRGDLVWVLFFKEDVDLIRFLVFEKFEGHLKGWGAVLVS
jgi:hypothetical protein